MSLFAPAFVPPSPPELRAIGAARLPLRVEPLALLMPLEGEFVARADDEIFRLRAGELLVLRTGAPLALERASTGAELLFFHASTAWLTAFRALHGESEGSAVRAPLDLVPAGTTLARRARQLLAGQRLSGAESGDRIPAATTAGLLEVAFEAAGSPLDPRRSRRRSGAQRETLIRALADYDPEADGTFSLCGLAERLGLSERQTARLVRGETGRSFRELKAAARLERARKLLASSELPILEVALRAGWNSASQFHEAFRRSVGVTPARYRSAHRG
jgi:AraC-like DNA-binding protein